MKEFLKNLKKQLTSAGIEQSTATITQGVGVRNPSGVRVRTVGWHIAVAVLGLLASRVRLANVLSPVGVILAAAVPGGFCLTAGVGAFAGYLFLPVVDTPFRYIACVFAVVSMRMLTQGLRGVSSSPPFQGLITVVAVTMCNIVAAINGDENILLLVCEGVLAGGLAYFAASAVRIDLSSGLGLSGEELGSAVITLNLCLVSLLPVGLGEFSLGRILGVSLVLAAARFGSVAGGAVAGSAVGFAVGLGTGSATPLSVLAVAGLCGGLFSAGGRLMTVGGFAVPAVISLSLMGAEGLSAAVAEILVGSGVFLLLPKGVLIVLASFFSPPTRLESLEGMRKSLVTRLRLASSALGDVSGTIDEVSTRLGKINLPEAGYVFRAAENDACRGCSFRVNCWETESAETLRALGEFANEIRHGGEGLAAVAPDFYKKCLRAERLEESVKKHYGEYLAKKSAEERIAAIRGVVADQFDGISDMLLDLSREFDKSRHYDLDTAQNVVSALREIGLLTTDCSCSVDKFGRMTVEAKLHNATRLHISRRKICEQLEIACERRFLPPDLKQIDEIIYLSCAEKPNLTPEIGVCQIPSSPSGICGDSYTYFADGFGRYFLLLSDGMGTGGRAAVDGAMTTGLLERLLRAGFGFDCSLKIVNSALLYKSSEESLSTADVTAIDLHSGVTGLYKAGAAPTLVRRGGRVGRAESRSLPIGILRDVGFDRSKITLKSGDIVAVLSDGATAAGTDWICAELESANDITAQELSERIAEGALRRTRQNHPDDITVMIVMLVAG